MVGKAVGEALEEIEAQGFIQLLDEVYRTGRPYIGRGAQLKLQLAPGAPPEDVVLDFIYQPLRDDNGEIEGIFVLANNVTEPGQPTDPP